ncbi:MAG: methyltransferase domain-containing protein [Bradyrhizobium icense]|jgi:sarcosine/dimethylglycine N-methyltransferase|nr:MAG: methyltransferase domain-containing protein [Bradyrhizobium icense]
MTGVSLAAMPLYTNLDRIARGLAASGIGPNDPVAPEQLFALDQWHYHGTDAIRAAAEWLALGPGSKVLDIGAGIGGPARYLAHTTGCHVTAIEVQPELNAIAVDLSRRSGLSDRIIHLCDDALTCLLPDASFDAVVSWLAVLHIPDRPRLCARLARALRPGGGCYLEDLCIRAPFVADDLKSVREIVCGVSMSSIEDYVKDLRSAGFVDVAATDLTGDWAPYAEDRLRRWRQDHEAYARVHGEQAYAAQEKFYSVIAHLYQSGSLGGVRLKARVP